MTTQEHMDKVALQYASALVRWHMTRNPENYQRLCEVQEKLNDLAVERAQELIEE